jgi:acetylornithine deacetylase/succinyl-diaminopimelate desuccinylase-like protein
MWGGYTGLGSKTVIPNEAFTKITMRLVPGQDPDACVAAVYKHLQAHCPASATLTFGAKRGSSRAYSLLDNHPLLLAAEETLRATTGRLPLRVGIGATLPVASIMAETLGIETVMFSYSTADEDYHAPNEFFRLSSIDEGFTGWVDLLRRLGQQSPDTYIPFRQKRSRINLGSSS